MAGSWEIKQSRQVLAGVLHTDTTTCAWAAGFRNLQIPGEVMFVAGMPFDMARNTIAAQALQNGFEWCFFLDSDVIPPRDAVLRLMSHRLPIVSGMYCRRSPPHAIPVMIRGDQWVTQFPQGKLIEVDLVGAGCLAIHRSVLEAFQKSPIGSHRGKVWFDWRVDMMGMIPRGEALSEDFSFCFTPDTWVAGPRMRKINKVKPGHLVVDQDGVYRKVLSTSNRSFVGGMIRLDVCYLGSLEATPGHRILVSSCPKKDEVFRQSKLKNVFGEDRSQSVLELAEWKEAKDIRVGDYVHVPKISPLSVGISEFQFGEYVDTRGMKQFPDGRIGYSRTRKSALRINPQIRVTGGLCRLLGYYLSQGWNNTNDQAVNFAFNKDYIRDIEDCQDLLSSIFGAASSVFVSGGAAKVVASSKVLGVLFSALCGKGAHHKHLPSFWTQLSSENLSELVKGYWRGDGFCSQYAFGMSTMSDRMARELQSSFLRLGILSGFSRKRNQYGVIHTLRIPRCLSSRFGKIVDHHEDCPEGEGHYAYLRETSTHFLAQVRDVENFHYDGEVYNLKVEESETYTANSVVVHNCLHARRKFGIKVMVDTAIQCRHVGFAQSTFGQFVPMETLSQT